MADLVFWLEVYNDIVLCFCTRTHVEVHMEPQDSMVSAGEGGSRVRTLLLCFLYEETKAQVAKVLFWLGSDKSVHLSVVHRKKLLLSFQNPA
jgi:hypothetical protein